MPRAYNTEHTAVSVASVLFIAVQIPRCWHNVEPMYHSRGPQGGGLHQCCIRSAVPTGCPHLLLDHCCPIRHLLCCWGSHRAGAVPWAAAVQMENVLMIFFCQGSADMLREQILGHLHDTKANELSLKITSYITLKFINPYSQIQYMPYLELSASLLQHLVALLYE